MEFTLFFLRWIHFLAGITWIRILYYFNFVQTPFFAETEAPVRVGAIQKLVPRALWWFRWGAMITFLAGALIYLLRMHEMGGSLFFSSAYGIIITVGGLIGTIMFLNVWLVIWPNQHVGGFGAHVMGITHWTCRPEWRDCSFRRTGSPTSPAGKAGFR